MQTTQLPKEGLNLKDFLAETEMNLISQALIRTDRVNTQAAKLLGLKRTTLIEKMRKYDMMRKKGQK